MFAIMYDSNHYVYIPKFVIAGLLHYYDATLLPVWYDYGIMLARFGHDSNTIMVARCVSIMVWFAYDSGLSVVLC